MRFSEVFKVVAGDEDWFDVLLSVDTRLFLDPFLVYAQEEGVFEGSHKDIIGFYNSVFKGIAKARGDPMSVVYKQAVGNLCFPEVEEVCLGYSAHRE